MVPGQGMPSYRHHDHGNLYIKFDIKFPPNQFATPDKLELLSSILPPRAIPELPTDGVIDEVELLEVDANQQARASGNAMSADEDDDDHPGHERVQCASQ